MDTLEEALARKERELEEFLASINNPKLRTLLTEIKTLKMAQAIVISASAPAPPSTTNGNGLKSVAGGMSRGDATEIILRETGSPVKAEDLLKEMPRFGIQTNLEFLISNLRKDRAKRFSIINGVVSLRAMPGEQPKGGQQAPGSNNGGGSALARMGFSLIGAIKDLLPKMHGEFSQPVVYKMLTEKHPDAAPHIQKASIATTLRKLADEGLIEVTYQGYGSEPRKYRRATK